MITSLEGQESQVVPTAVQEHRPTDLSHRNHRGGPVGGVRVPELVRAGHGAAIERPHRPVGDVTGCEGHNTVHQLRVVDPYQEGGFAAGRPPHHPDALWVDAWLAGEPAEGLGKVFEGDVLQLLGQARARRRRRGPRWGSHVRRTWHRSRSCRRSDPLNSKMAT